MSPAEKRTGMSLEYKLPLLITALLVSTVVIGMLLAYLEVQRSAVESARTRLELVSQDLVRLIAPGIEQQIDTLRAVGESPALMQWLSNQAEQPPDEALAALSRLRIANQPDVRVLLLDSSLTPLLELPTGNSAGDRLPVETFPRTGYGAFFFDDGSVRYWTASPIGQESSPLGFVAQLRSVSGGDEENPIEAFLGREAELLLANDAPGTPWVSLGGDTTTAPAGWPFAGAGEYVAVDGGSYLVHSQPLPPTPWRLIARAPASAVLARPNAFAARAGLLVLVLGLAGAGAAWALSWRITQPIKALRQASEAIGKGDYGRRIEVSTSDELGLLADAYNRMADRIRTAHFELTEQYDTANALAAELDQASRAKSEFLATMSHEIRTPINAIIGYTDILLLGVKGPVNEKQIEQLERVRISGRHLVTLVDQVLDLARVESGKLSLQVQTASTAESIDTMLTVLRPQAEAKGIEISSSSADGALEYVGDSHRVDQILVNLLSNAIKFTEPGGKVTIRSWLCDEPLPVDGREGPWTCISVQDTGLGIPPAETEKIFGAFVQVESGYTRRHGGAGLGLAISLRLARSMGGDLTVESELGVGSTFTLWLDAPTP